MSSFNLILSPYHLKFKKKEYLFSPSCFLLFYNARGFMPGAFQRANKKKLGRILKFEK